MNKLLTLHLMYKIYNFIWQGIYTLNIWTVLYINTFYLTHDNEQTSLNISFNSSTQAALLKSQQEHGDSMALPYECVSMGNITINQTNIESLCWDRSLSGLEYKDILEQSSAEKYNNTDKSKEKVCLPLPFKLSWSKGTQTFLQQLSAIFKTF